MMWAVFLAVLIPWVSPVTLGPSAAVVPLIVASAAALVLWVVTSPPAQEREPWRLGVALAVGGLALQVGGQEGAALGVGLLTLLLTYFSAAAQPAPELVRAVMWAWLVAALLSVVVGLAQYFGLASHLLPFVDVSSPGVAYGNLRQRNQFASLTMIGLAVLPWLAGRGQRLRWLLLAAVVLAVGNAASASRTGVLQLVLMWGVVAVWERDVRSRAALPLGVAVLAYAAASVALPWLLGMTGQSGGESALWRLAHEDGCSSRRVLWSNVLTLIGQKPWLGWGWGNLDFAHYMTLYSGERFCDILDNAHNLPLHLAVEFGIPVAVLVCGWVLFCVVSARPWAETNATRRAAWLVLLVIGLHSLLEYPIWYGHFEMAAAWAAGLLWPLSRSATDPSREDRMGFSPVRVAGAALMGAALMYAAWDYHRISQVYLPPQERDPVYRTNTMAKAQKSWLFHNAVDFALLTTTEVRRDNALPMHALALDLLHYSPEPRVIEKVIESATLLGDDQEALAHAARYRAAFPTQYAEWAVSHTLPGASAPVAAPR